MLAIGLGLLPLTGPLGGCVAAVGTRPPRALRIRRCGAFSQNRYEPHCGPADTLRVRLPFGDGHRVNAQALGELLLGQSQCLPDALYLNAGHAESLVKRYNLRQRPASRAVPAMLPAHPR